MSERQAPYLTYDDTRLFQAQREVQARVQLAERCLETALAREQQAQAATVSVRRYLARAKSDERLIAAILKERQNLFEEEEGEARTSVQPEDTPPYLTSTGDGAPRPDSSPGPCVSTSPSSLRQQLFSRSAYR
jgi:hypothetical protein